MVRCSKTSIKLFFIIVFFISTSAQADLLKIGGTGDALAPITFIGDSFEIKYPEHTVDSPVDLGTNGSIKAVIDNVLDIALSSRPLTPLEKSKGAQQFAYARTPFVFVTSKSGISYNLTNGDIFNIYSGIQSKWQKDKLPIRIILRSKFDNHTFSLRRFFPKMDIALQEAYSRPSVPVVYTDFEALDLAERVPGSFSTASLTTVVSGNRRLNIFAINGVSATVHNLVREAYPYYIDYYLIIGPEASKTARLFLDFMYSLEATVILRSLGNIPLLKGEE